MRVPPLPKGRTPWVLPEGTTYVIDLETDGLLDVVSRLHVMVVRDASSGALVCSLGGPAGVSAGEVREALAPADALVAHNGFRFDYPVLRKLVGWEPLPHQQLLDTLPLSRLIFSHLKNMDAQFYGGQASRSLKDEAKLPLHLWGSHGMEAWGYRLGETKVGADISEWAVWTPLMQERCESDTAVNLRLLQLLASKEYSAQAVELELRVARLCAGLELAGFPFDTALAEKVTGELCVRRAQLEAQMRTEIPGWWRGCLEPLTPTKSRKVFVEHPGGTEVNRGTKKTPNMVRGWHWSYDHEAPHTPVEWVVFNPGSGPQIVEYLGKLHGWQPEEYTPKGNPKVDEKTVGKLPWPEAKLITKYLTVRKRLGQIAEGNKAWLKVVNNGRVHGGINPNGAVTGRATHSEPNLAQVPRVHQDKEGNVLHGEAGGWGWECRSMFTAPPGMVLVGSDLSKLELLCLSHYLAAYDGGDYAQVLLSGIDPHEHMAAVAGFNPKSERSKGKTLNYAFLYGGGDAKLGLLVDPKATGLRQRQLGKELRAKVLRSFGALGQLTAALKFRMESLEQAGLPLFLYGLDGRAIPVRHNHAVLNTLLQGAGAAVAKAWLVQIEDLLRLNGLQLSTDWQLHAFVHDEAQFSVRPEHGELARTIAIEAASKAGKTLRMRVPILADAKVGLTWSSSH